MSATDWALPSGTELLWVDTEEQLEALESGLIAVCAEAGGCCGVDAEWPSAERAAEPGGADVAPKGAASLVQLALAWPERESAVPAMPVVALLDLLALPLASARGTLLRLFENERILKLGLSVKGDIRAINKALAAREPPLPPLDLARVTPLFDLASWRPFFGAGLSAIVEATLPGKTLGKAQQCSDWAARPLSPEQLRYAAADPAVCVAVFDEMCAQHGVARQAATSFPIRAQALAFHNQSLPRKAVANRPDAYGAGQRGSNWSGAMPWPMDNPGVAHVRFVCDIAAEGLARGLRMCGIDAASVQSGCPAVMDPHQWVADASARHGRVILTTDGKLFRKVQGYPAYLVRSGGKQRQVHEVVRFFNVHVDTDDLLSRCTKCNGDFRLMSAKEAAARGGEAYERAPDREYWECTGCQQQYWKGGQFARAMVATERLRSMLEMPDATHQAAVATDPAPA
eukprot:jgi/Tetstr1/449251/TSEL_036456.t1